jgi:hypothetical protein
MGVEINNSFHFQNILHTLFRQMVGQNENQYPDLDSSTHCVICHCENPTGSWQSLSKKARLLYFVRNDNFTNWVLEAYRPFSLKDNRVIIA